MAPFEFACFLFILEIYMWISSVFKDVYVIKMCFPLINIPDLCYLLNINSLILPVPFICIYNVFMVMV